MRTTLRVGDIVYSIYGHQSIRYKIKKMDNYGATVEVLGTGEQYTEISLSVLRLVKSGIIKNWKKELQNGL